ncbi:MAG: hypothetical protein ABIS47_09935 [Acidimicrobiales bacterium]
MAPGLKSLAALAAAAAMVGAAILGRGALDTKKGRDDLRLTVACDPAARAFCEAAAGADPRLTIKVESPEVTTKRLRDLADGARPDIQAWVSLGPWLQMADGRRVGPAPLQREVRPVASTPLVLVTRLGQNLGSCGKPPAGCLPLPSNRVGLPSPKSSGIGLAGLAQIVLARTGTAAADLDRSALESGEGAAVIDALSKATDPRAGFEQLNAGFSQANPLVNIKAAAAPAAGRASVIPSEPAVRVVLQVGILDEAAIQPLSGGEAAGRALAKAATDAGWEAPGPLAGGLPDPGVLAALQDAWRGP